MDYNFDNNDIVGKPYIFLYIYIYIMYNFRHVNKYPKGLNYMYIYEHKFFKI